MANDTKTPNDVIDVQKSVNSDNKREAMNSGNNSDEENIVPGTQNEGEIERSPTHSSSSSDSVTNGSNSNDFVIRDGFPALRLPGNVGWNIKNEEPIPNHSFRVEPNLLRLSSTTVANGSPDSESDKLWESLLNDATTVFTARTRDDSAAYSVGTTYFCPAQMKPRCALEDLVLSIYKKHTDNLPSGIVIPEQSGAEWWTLVLDQNNEDNKHEGDEDDDEDDDDVGMHFDADYGLEDQAPNLLLHPRLATVTYLTNVGAPTLILDQRSPPPADVEKKTLQGSIRRGWLSHPYKGKHISFDGRLLHGAPSTFFPPYKKSSQSEKETNNDWGWDDDEQPPSKKAKTDVEPVQTQTPLEQNRITLLVNVWINHCPLDAEPLEDEVIEKLVTPWKSDDATGDEKQQRASISWVRAEDEELLDTNDLAKVHLKAAKPTSPNSFAAMNSKEVEAAGEEEVVIGGRLVTISYGASMEAFHTASEVAHASKLGCIELELDREVIALTVGEEVEDTDESEED